MADHIGQHGLLDNSAILLTAAMGGICPAGEDCLGVTVKSVFSREIEYIIANGVYESIIRLQDGAESARPDADDCR